MPGPRRCPAAEPAPPRSPRCRAAAAWLAAVALLGQVLLGLAPVAAAPGATSPEGPRFAVPICTPEGLRDTTTPEGAPESPDPARRAGGHCVLCLAFAPVGLPGPAGIPLQAPAADWRAASIVPPAPLPPRGREPGGPPGARAPPNT